MIRKLTLLLFTSIAISACNTTDNSLNKSSPRSKTEVAKAQATDNQSLDEWINEDLTDYLNSLISDTPKFKNQEILFVAMQSEQISGDIDNLTADIRAQLMDNLLANKDVNLVRRQLDYQASPHRSISQLSCDNDTDIKYYFGLSIDESSISGKYTVRLRATDSANADQWLGGISLKWTGLLSTGQLAALQEKAIDPYLRGLRSQPYKQGDADLLALHLSHNLACLLSQTLNDDITVYTPAVESDAPEIKVAVNLVDNYLSRFSEVKQTQNIANANAILDHEFLKIDKDSGLSVLNMSINFVDSGERVNRADTQAYILLNSAPSADLSNNSAFIESGGNIVSNNIHLTSTSGTSNLNAKLALVVPNDFKECRKDNPWSEGEKVFDGKAMLENDCFAIEYKANGDSNYLLYKNTNNQVFQLSPVCLTQDIMQEKVRLPSAKTKNSVIYLDKNPGTESFYIVAMTNNSVTHSIKRALKNIPAVCSKNYQTLGGDDLEALLAKTRMENYPGIKWQQVDINHIQIK